MQVQEGVHRVIAHNSMSFNKAQRHYLGKDESLQD